MLHVAQPTDAGVARCVADTAIAQAAAGWQVDVACPGGGKLEHWLAGTAVRHLPVMLRREPGASVLAEVRAVRRILRAVPYDLLHLHSSKAGLVGRLAGRGRVPTVFQPHAWSFHATNGRLTGSGSGSPRDGRTSCCA